MPHSIAQLLERSRQELLDLSTRNRLLSIPVGSRNKLLHIVDERSEQVFKRLVEETKSFTFLPGKPSVSAKSKATKARSKLAETAVAAIASGEADEPEDEFDGLSLPESDELDPVTGVYKRHSDSRLQTALTPEGLQARLLGLHRDARTMIEEQGVNILYLALGQLQWMESEKAESPRFAPLVLVPVGLARKTASDSFYLGRLPEDVQENLSLRAKLKADFGIDLPPFPEEDDFDISKYFEALRKTVTPRAGWEVLPDKITLGFFSFAKFLMFRDLDPENWPRGKSLAEHSLLSCLLQDGFPQSESLFPENAPLDEMISADRLDHVVDADSSQTVAIETVRKGRSVVIQGPPGTGKSQSISNIIATAVLDGKKVLFVAEKLAALEVVKRRLENEGLGDMCLELHSNKSNKRAVVDELARTWGLGKPLGNQLEATVSELDRHRSTLNGYVTALHQTRMPSELSPYTLLGMLSQMGDGVPQAASVTFPEAERWTPQQRRERLVRARELAELLSRIQNPARHPWRGVGCEPLLRMDLEPLGQRIRALQLGLQSLIETAGALAQALAQPPPANLREARFHLLMANFLMTAPSADKQAVANPVWNGSLAPLQKLVAQGRAWVQARAELASEVSESVWQQDFLPTYSAIKTDGAHWYRFFLSSYREAKKGLESICIGRAPDYHAARLVMAQRIADAQILRDAIRNSNPLGQGAFGTLWLSEDSDWDRLELIIQWVGRQEDAGLDSNFRALFASLEDATPVPALFQVAATAVERIASDFLTLTQFLKLNSAEAFGVAQIEEVPIQAILERCTQWSGQIEGLLDWTQYSISAAAARSEGLGALLELYETGQISADSIPACFEGAVHAQLLRLFLRETPVLAQFSGVRHQQVVQEFRGVDKTRLAVAKHRVVKRHHGALPARTGIGPSGILQGEMQRKRGHMPVRRLLKNAAPVVQAIKPVFMMSPLSVAQFLEPGALEFDLLVVDEASQVQPVDALGAIARCRQMVVVGDSRQLPPTRFFARMTTDSAEADEWDDSEQAVVEAADVESVLGLCCARGLPQTMLQWHYRSRHHSLIAVSNEAFYEQRLFIVPSPMESNPALGLRFHFVPEGVFDRGGTSTNREEAKAVARAVVEHARQSPHLSLGVGAFSVKQQHALIHELELLRRANPDTEPFFAAHENEPFFVKNLENIQGDERDVIFISVGYGKNAQGYMTMSFGPLSGEGGERRLNVLITRAKRRCEVFASITDEDIDLERAKGLGVKAFKSFLKYARTGILTKTELTGRSEDSPFETAVRMALEAQGHKVDTQVGVAGFFIDLGVRHPEKPGHHILGIECDGAAYHSSRSARDRDRLRQAVLEDHGWCIHRIWSTDWFQRPAEQLKLVEAAIRAALMKAEQLEPAILGEAVVAESESAPFGLVSRESPTTADTASPLLSEAVAYKVAKVDVPRHREIHEISTGELVRIVTEIVRQEGPVHEAEVVVRVRELWGLARAGSRIQEAVTSGIREAVSLRKCESEGGFLCIPGGTVSVRNREAVDSANLRKADYLPPMEIREAILTVLNASLAANEEEIVTATLRMFGFKSSGSGLKSAIEEQLKLLKRSRILENVNGVWRRRKK